jgi:hypothetical protein
VSASSGDIPGFEGGGVVAAVFRQFSAGFRGVRLEGDAIVFIFQEKSIATRPAFPHFPALVWFGA